MIIHLYVYFVQSFNLFYINDGDSPAFGLPLQASSHAKPYLIYSVRTGKQMQDLGNGHLPCTVFSLQFPVICL